MNDEFYIIYDRNGMKRTTKKPPQLGAGEHCTRIVLRVPDRFFSNPIPTAVMEVPETAVGGPVPAIDLSSMDEVCMVQEGIAAKTEGGDNCYRCPGCGFEHWKQDFGTHYKPAVE